jgi:hypothetical protein
VPVTLACAVLTATGAATGPARTGRIDGAPSDVRLARGGEHATSPTTIVRHAPDSAEAGLVGQRYEGEARQRGCARTADLFVAPATLHRIPEDQNVEIYNAARRAGVALRIG